MKSIVKDQPLRSNATFDHRSGDVLPVEGADIYYEDRGARDAPALLFLHGGIGTMEDFNVILANLDLEKNFRVLGIDSRGHGRSTLGSSALTYERLQKDVEAVLAHLQIKAVSIVGFSDGGIVAYRLAAMTTLRVTKLVTIGARHELKPESEVRELLAKTTAQSWRKKFPEMCSVYQRLNPAPDFDRFVAAVVKMWLDESSSGYPAHHVEKIQIPALIVRGDDDRMTSRAAFATLADRMKSARFSNIAFAGHVAFADQPEIFVSDLRRFLKP